jgi:flagellar biosynthesis/type III secretory pathway chaperone
VINLNVVKVGLLNFYQEIHKLNKFWIKLKRNLEKLRKINLKISIDIRRF